MEITAIMIGVLFAIVLSNILAGLFPSLPLPLIQIAFGCVMALIFLDRPIELEPEIFMVMIIAPLLFREADETDLFVIWEVKKSVFLMAFIVVFITVFAIGLSVHAVIPAVPLAACFALGAILGPTDVVAVMSLSRRVTIKDKLKNILMGEGLINDASGITAFRFAVAALLTGGFSPLRVTAELIVVSVGGCLVGFLLSTVSRRAVTALKRLSVHNIGTYMLLELMMPFISYMAAELVGVSGILAAVTAGSRQTIRFRKADIREAEFRMSKNATWEMLTFTLNSLVFILLGLQLPEIITGAPHETDYGYGFLILLSVLVTLILMVVRFLSVLLLVNSDIGVGLREKLKSTLILTLSGVKGAVSLATAFALPLLYDNGTIFHERPLLLFITAGTIILSFLLALVLLPVVADNAAQKENREDDLRLDILREVVAQLQAARVDEADSAVIASYDERIRNLEHARFEHAARKKFRKLRVFMFRTERRAARTLLKKQAITPELHRAYRELLFVLYHDDLRGAEAFLPALRIMLLRLFRFAERLATRRSERTETAFGTRLAALRNLFRDNTAVVTAALESKRPEAGDTLTDHLIEERRRAGRNAGKGFAGGGHLHPLLSANYEDEILSGFYVERRVIHQFLEKGLIDPEFANVLRRDVSTLELYILSEHNDSKRGKGFDELQSGLKGKLDETDEDDEHTFTP